MDNIQISLKDESKKTAIKVKTAFGYHTLTINNLNQMSEQIEKTEKYKNLKAFTFPKIKKSQTKSITYPIIERKKKEIYLKKSNKQLTKIKNDIFLRKQEKNTQKKDVKEIEKVNLTCLEKTKKQIKKQIIHPVKIKYGTRIKKLKTCILF
jgi:CHAT domain-containing protein